MTWCDVCGDITKAWKPVEVRFPGGSKLVINVCLGCWEKYFEESRKVKVAKVIEVLKGEV